jgi:phospholipid/cholesterol/gamma-HCH transport system substrate-binding protein
MDRHGIEFRVGLFTVVCVAVFVALLGVVSMSALRADRDRYFVRFEENVKGMAVGSMVNFQGIPIGQVVDMRFDRGATLVEIGVDPERAQLQDTVRARMDRALVTGQVSIELEGFAVDGAPLPAGAVIDSISSPIDALASSLPELLDGASLALARIVQVLDDDRLARIDALLEAAEQTAVRLPDAVTSVAYEATATLVELRHTATSARGALDRLEQTVGQVGAVVDSTSHDAGQLMQTIGNSVQDTERRLSTTLGAVERLASHVDAPSQRALAEIRDALRAVRVLAERLGAAPSSLLWGTTEREITVPSAPGGGR